MRYKFRAWSKTEKKWYDRVLCGCDSDGNDYVCHLVYSEELGDWTHFDDGCGTVVQFTGLHDRNGKEIYESDIIQYDNERYEVYWSHDWAMFTVKGPQVQALMRYAEYGEVIGNSLENPELLGGTADVR